MATGSVELANEHLLHSRHFNKGSSKHYFDETAIEFAKLRQDTFKKTYQSLDNLVLKHCEVIYDGFMDDDQEIHDCTPIPAKFVVNTQFGQVEVAKFRRADGPLEFSSWKDFLSHAEVSSPIASYCMDGTTHSVWLPVSKRPGAISVIRDQIDLQWDVPSETDETKFLNDL